MKCSAAFLAAFFGIVFLSTSLSPAQAVGWAQQTSPTGQALYGVASSDANTWVAVGDIGTIVRSTNGGIAWSSVSSPVGDQLRAVSFNGATGLAVGLAGRVLRSTDAGATWVEETRPIHKNLYSVSFGTAFAVITGEEGTILVSTDGGLTWTQHFAGTASVLFGVSVSGNTGVGVGGQGAVVMSDNVGAGWGLTVLGTQLTFFYGTSFATPTTGWLVGTSDLIPSIIARSDLSGFTWTAQTSPTSSALFGVSFPSINVGTAVGASGAIIHTTNGGQLWSNQQSGVTQTLNAVSFATADLGIVVGDQGMILRTTTGGTAAVGDPVLGGQGAARLCLEQNTPNPFSPSTTIRFMLMRPGFVSLKIYNLAGEEVATLASEEMKPGPHEASWNGLGKPSGVYFARLRTTGGIETRKMILK
jgi:photosystem II stability/assembly factor-like uncharacterized protein